jgi:hypothetical protein
MTEQQSGSSRQSARPYFGHRCNLRDRFAKFAFGIWLHRCALESTLKPRPPTFRRV